MEILTTQNQHVPDEIASDIAKCVVSSNTKVLYKHERWNGKWQYKCDINCQWCSVWSILKSKTSAAVVVGSWFSHLYMWLFLCFHEGLNPAPYIANINNECIFDLNPGWKKTLLFDEERHNDCSAAVSGSGSVVEGKTSQGYRERGAAETGFPLF